MAQGTFTLTAFLVGTPAVGDAASESASSEPTATGDVVETPTASVFELDPFTATASTPARTPTPSTSSYPSYP